MFVCHKSFEFPFPPFLRSPGSGYYRAVELSLQLPWFIVTYLIHEGENSCLRSVCCNWDNDLIELIAPQALTQAPQTSPPTQHTVASLQQVVPQRDGNGWAVRDIRSVWTANEVASDEQVVILEDADGVQFNCGFPTDELPVVGERRLVARSACRGPRMSRPILFCGDPHSRFHQTIESAHRTFASSVVL